MSTNNETEENLPRTREIERGKYLMLKIQEMSQNFSSHCIALTFDSKELILKARHYGKTKTSDL